MKKGRVSGPKFMFLVSEMLHLVIKFKVLSFNLISAIVKQNKVLVLSMNEVLNLQCCINSIEFMLCCFNKYSL